MNLKDFWQKIIHGEENAAETEFLPAILEVTETPPSPVGRMVMWSIMVLLTAALLWAVLGKIDEVAVAEGKIVPLGQVKMVQAEDKGIVKKIYVKDGERVKKGQLLIEMDPTVSTADLESLQKRAAYYQLDIDRLTAEMNGTPFSPALNENLTERDIMTQEQLYQSRTAEFNAQKSAAEMRIEQNKSAVQSAEAQKSKNEKLLAISRDKEKRLKSLVDRESVAQFDYLNEKGNRVNYEMTVKALDEEIAKAKAEMAESERQLADVVAAYRKDVMSQMAEARKQLYAYQEELKKAAEKKKFAKIVSPCDGRVNQLALHTVGGIVTEAQGLMMIVPDNVTMEIEAWADNKDIGFIKIGQRAEVKVATFNFQKYGVVEARVKEISPDAMADDRDQATYKKYRITLSMDKTDMIVNDQGVPLSPGMAVTAEIKIKQKRIIDFFLDPFRRYQSEALRER